MAGRVRAPGRHVWQSCAAGNFSPAKSTLGNEAPWMPTVGASTLDREIRSATKLGNGKIYRGQLLFQPGNFQPALVPLVYPGSNGDYLSTICSDGQLTVDAVSGKVVLCEATGRDEVEKGEIVLRAGGMAMILMSTGAQDYDTIADAHVLLTSQVSFLDGTKIKGLYKLHRAPHGYNSLQGHSVPRRRGPHGG
ncbi:hypothetical protein AMTR_s00069p00180390 [Amborella trichopoda]|uniref:PA domain-containing protein n=1 Tax=Amborella trichopoda TaxID=13333 RepID=U5D1E6_AMBTC|nr:hypothetical protein AMTR_s00069p00180390 [Amborella trichopoda]